MQTLDEFCAALAAALINDEITWRLHRLPQQPERQTAMEKAVLQEAKRRGLTVEA